MTIQEQLENIFVHLQKDEFTKPEYLELVKEKQIDLDFAEQYLQEMYQKGELIQPKEGKYRYIE